MHAAFEGILLAGEEFSLVFFGSCHLSRLENWFNTIEVVFVNTKIWYRRSLICGSNPVKRSVREKEGFFRKIRQRSPRLAICFRSAGKLFALILWDCAMTWPERKGQMDG
jgi:hypothetical protein